MLVVDEPDGRDLLELGLEMAGYQVDVADDGEAGLITAGARTPAAAIMDLNVSIIDGQQHPAHVSSALSPWGWPPLSASPSWRRSDRIRRGSREREEGLEIEP